MFGLQPHLDALYEDTQRQFTLQAEHANVLQAWQVEFRHALRDLLGIASWTAPTTPHAELLSTVNKGSYSEEKYALDGGEGVSIPMYILVPDAAPPHKAIIALHGHGPGVGMILGHYDEASAKEHIASDNNFAQKLAQDGYLVCAIEQRGFGERVTNQPNENGNACRHLAFEYMMEGRSLLGERIRDAMIAISYVQSRGDVVTSSLGCVGFSGGGTTGLFLSALDERITTSVIGGYFCTFKRSILGVRHCECNYVPGLLQLGEAGDIGALIAPRPIRIISGEQDPIFPVAGVHEQYETLAQAYDVLNVADKCSLAIHAEGHRYQHRSGVEWFNQWL